MATSQNQTQWQQLVGAILLFVCCLIAFPNQGDAYRKSKHDPIETVEDIQTLYTNNKKPEAIALAKELLIFHAGKRAEIPIYEYLKKIRQTPSRFFSKKDWLNLAEGYIKNGLPREALKIYAKLDPTGNNLIIEIANATYLERNYGKAAELYQSLWDHPKKIDDRKLILTRLSKAYGRSDQFDKAIDYHRIIIQKYPNSKLAHNSKFNIAFLYFDKGDYHKARIAYQQLKPKGRFERNLIDEKVFWATYLLNEYENALKLAEKLEKQQRRNWQKLRYQYWQARILGKLNQKKLARQLYRKIYRYQPHSYYGFRALEKLSGKQIKPKTKFKSNGNKFSQYINRYTKKFDIDSKLVWALMKQESNFRETAISSAQALGLMQIIPQTALEIANALNEKNFYPEDLLTNPELNIKFGSWYLSYLWKMHQSHPVYTVASYNAGPDAVNRWKKWGAQLENDEFIELIPYQETNNYVKKILRNYWR